MENQLFNTAQGLQALKDELDYLKNEKREEVKKALAVARSYGDLSENSEYDEARNEQAKVEQRITELEQIILNTVVIDESEIDSSKVHLGSTVKVEITNYDGTVKETVYNIVGSNESNPPEGKISDRSPIGVALVGAHKGETVTVSAPRGERKIKILEVTRTKH